MITVHWNGSSYKTASDYAYQPPEGAIFSPMDILCESLGMCIAVSLVRLLEQAEVRGEELTVEVEPFKAAVGAPRVEKLRVTAALPKNLDKSLTEQLLLQASRICTIGNTLKRGAEITYELRT